MALKAVGSERVKSSPKYGTYTEKVTSFCDNWKIRPIVGKQKIPGATGDFSVIDWASGKVSV